jgi:hypothetical protein
LAIPATSLDTTQGLIGSASERRSRIEPNAERWAGAKNSGEIRASPAITAMLSAVSLPGSTGTAGEDAISRFALPPASA